MRGEFGRKLVNVIVGLAKCAAKWYNLGVKKIILSLAIIIAVLSALGSLPNVDFARAEEKTKYSVSVASDGGKAVGAKMSGYFFAESGILSSVEIYSIDGSTIDFDVNSSNLTESQRVIRSKVFVLFDQIADVFLQVSDSVNVDDPQSDVAKFNAATSGQTVYVGEHTLKMLSIAKEAYDFTGGKYNPAAYRLVDLWGFSSRIFSRGQFGLPYDRPVSSQEFASNGYPLPERKYIDAFSDKDFLKFDVDIDYAQSNAKTDGNATTYPVKKSAPDAVVDGTTFSQWIDLGGIAKGYAADVAKEIVSQHTSDFCIDTGASSIILGNNHGGGDFEVSVIDPYDYNAAFPQTIFSVNQRNAAISTSGLYVRNYVSQGARYTHIIDCDSGMPVSGGAESVTIVIQGEDYVAAKSDCLTTAICAMSATEIADFVSELSDSGAYLAALYLTDGGAKQLLTNLPQNRINGSGKNFSSQMFALTQTDSGWAYDPSAGVKSASDGKTIGIVVAVSVAVVTVAVCVTIALIRKKSKGGAVDFKKQKPFAVGDVVAYLLIALLVVVLFSTVMPSSDKISVIKIVDMESGQTIAVCNVSSGKVSVTSSPAHTVTTSVSGNEITVTISTDIDGKTKQNTLTVGLGSSVWAQMTDSDCGFGKDCVRVFGKITSVGEVIVCNPNRIKVVAE